MKHYIQELKSLTNKPIIKAVRVLSQEDIEAAQHTAADFLLLDNGAGGTGESFDWSLVGKVTETLFPSRWVKGRQY